MHPAGRAVRAVTTVAFKAGVLASDSRATWDGNVKGHCCKMWRLQSRVEPVKGECLLAIAGDLYDGLLFKDWLEQGGEPKLKDRGVCGDDGDSGGDFDALIVHRSGIYGANFLCRLERITEDEWAHGSGRPFALAAMACGKSAIEAVRVAARFDAYTGGRIVSMTLEDKAPARARKRG